MQNEKEKLQRVQSMKIAEAKGKKKENTRIERENRINGCNCVIRAVFQPGNDIFPDGQTMEKK